MSAHHRARRSTSKTAPETGGDIAQSNGTVPTSNSDLPDPSPTRSPSHLSAPTSLPSLNPKSPPASDTTMLSTLVAPTLVTNEPQIAEDTQDGFDDHPDNRSSSLSELGDASDEQSEATPRPTTTADVNDNDSEAETERLETTPRKLTRTATNTSLTSEQMYERTPSKLAHSKTIDQEDPIPPTPSILAENPTIGDAADGESGLHALSLVADSEAANLEFAGKKRKRSSAESSLADEQSEEPARKRSSTVKDQPLNGTHESVVEPSEQIDVEEELENAEERISQLAQEELELEERQADIAAEAVTELATVAKHTKPRKGGRRGKRKVEDTSHIDTLADTHEAEAEGDNDEEDSAAHDEEVAKKKNAIDELAKIEKKFKIFREKLCDEQIAQCEQELEMLRQPNCIHPEYLAMIKSVDDRRAEKIAYERQLLQYKQKNLEIITTAERHQIHSQYFQTVRDVRENILSECNQRVFELQRGRRQLGVDEVEYMMKLPEKRSDQIRHQAAYNLEVSILSGVAKYVGFPAAPEIRPARPSEIEDDLRAMKIATRPAAPPPYVRPFNRTSDEAAAEEQFLERTPWANPRHPAHQETHYSIPPGPSRIPSYQTPAGQRRMVDINAPNGSASTIEVNSNPPSSTAGAGPHNINSRLRESESPVLQMKRNPSDHLAFSETPGSHSRNIVGLARDSHGSNVHMLSSPALQHSELQLDEQSARWGGRPLNAGTQSIPSRQDAARAPLPQRSGLGTVSVGNGNGIFGR